LNPVSCILYPGSFLILKPANSLQQHVCFFRIASLRAALAALFLFMGC
jgi:hypothetical protein